MPKTQKPQNTRGLVAHLKSTCSRRREGWKKSFKNFSPSQPNERESIYAGYQDRPEAAKWIHKQCICLHLAPDSIALSFAILDRILFGMKVKKCHLPVVAAASISLAAKMLEDEQFKNLGKYLVKAADMAFSVRDLNRMETMVISKFDWDLNWTTCMDFLFSLFDFCTLGSTKRIGTRSKNILAHFLASQLTNFELARMPALEIALGCLMAAKQKTATLRLLNKMHKLGIDFDLAQNAARILKPQFVRLKVYLPPYALNQIPAEFASEEDENSEIETLSSVRKLFSHGCLEPTPFGSKSFAEITAEC
jgi:hypothetical protein